MGIDVENWSDDTVKKYMNSFLVCFLDMYME